MQIWYSNELFTEGARNRSYKKIPEGLKLISPGRLPSGGQEIWNSSTFEGLNFVCIFLPGLQSGAIIFSPLSGCLIDYSNQTISLAFLLQFSFRHSIT